jgi:hypothetical protein
MNVPITGSSVDRISKRVNKATNSSLVGLWNIAKLHRLPDNWHSDYLRVCECGNIIYLNLSSPEQPEYWTCICGSTNKTFWTPSDEFIYQLGL